MPRPLHSLIVLCTTLVATTILAAPTTQPLDPDAAINPCTAHLLTLGKALAAYRHDHAGHMPNQLSDLYPAYVPDRAVFHCPADPSPDGDPARGFAHRDPKMPMSYSYDWSADESHGLPQPFGPFPAPDVGNAWGTCRLVAERQTHFFGDRVPVVRCFHHKTEDSDAPKVLTLTQSGQIYHSHGVWEDAPDTFATVLACIARDLAAGDQTFLDNWRIGMVAGYASTRLEDPDCVAAAHTQLAPLATALEAFADRNHDSTAKGAANVTAGETARLGLRLASQLHLAAGDPAAALTDFTKGLHGAILAGNFAPPPPSTEPSAKSKPWTPPIESDLRFLARLYRANGQPELATLIMLSLHATRPTVHVFMSELADLHDELHSSAAAERWRDLAEPSRRLVGSTAPDFTLPAFDGSPASLADLRRNHKATLIDFFFVGCGPCRAAAPQLEDLYTRLSPQGLQVIAIDVGDSPDAVTRSYVKTFSLTHPVLIAPRPTGDAPDHVAHRYHVDAFPTTYLLDPDGKVLWQSVGYEGQGLPKLKEQLKALGLNP